MRYSSLTTVSRMVATEANYLFGAAPVKYSSTVLSHPTSSWVWGTKWTVRWYLSWFSLLFIVGKASRFLLTFLSCSITFYILLLWRRASSCFICSSENFLKSFYSASVNVDGSDGKNGFACKGLATDSADGVTYFLGLGSFFL